jgi:hypothetical protein
VQTLHHLTDVLKEELVSGHRKDNTLAGGMRMQQKIQYGNQDIVPARTPLSNLRTSRIYLLMYG